jgi:hypothetical protein
MKHPTQRVALIAALIGFALVPLDASAQTTGAQPAGGALAGVYKLAQVDNADLPFVLGEADGCKREITAANLTLTADSKWKIEATVRQTCGEKIETKTETGEGMFAAQGAAIDLDPATQKAEEDKDPANIKFLQLADATLSENVLKVRLTEDKNILSFRR